VSFAAGLAEMAVAKFLLFTVIGCAIWCTGLSLLGYSLGSTYDHVQKSFSDATYVILVLFVLAVVFLIWHRFRTVREERL
jgi:membrane protein DedA with SNARE-associated domain